jgi:hypothetical protein
MKGLAKRKMRLPFEQAVNIMLGICQGLDYAHDIAGFDGGRAKRRVGIIVAVLMLLIIAGVVTMAILSHN